MKIYNLFPRVSGKITEWKNHLDRISYMGFDYIYINPIFETGYSGSLYAPKNFYSFDPTVIDSFSDLSPEDQIRDFINEAHNRGIKVMIEMILTHTAIDSELLLTNPDWFKYENNELKKFSFKDEERWLEWGDLIEIDNDNSIDKDNLWQYWKNLIYHFLSLGFDGFKFEAAYKISTELCKYLISDVKEKREDIIFIGDNLGASFFEMIELAQSGFDYLFTSLRWWDFSSTWFLEQHYKLKDIVKLISFPENYDTERVADLYNANRNASKALYTFSAFFNSGVMIPIGYEQGCTNKFDVINSYEDDLYEKNMDIQEFIKKINYIKNEYQIFKEETDLFFITSSNEEVFIFKKISRNKEEEVLVIVNMNYEENEEVEIKSIREILMKDLIIDISPEDKQIDFNDEYHYELRPGEVRVLYSK